MNSLTVNLAKGVFLLVLIFAFKYVVAFLLAIFLFFIIGVVSRIV